MVGEAFTLRYIPAREDLNPIEVFKDPKHLQRVAVEKCPAGSIMVIDSRKNARAASAGSILITRLMVRGAAGIVTDGGFRDSAEIAALDFSSYHHRHSAPTNLTLHQAIAINEPIGCGDVAVFPGDFLVGDYDGVMVIPAKIYPKWAVITFIVTWTFALGAIFYFYLQSSNIEQKTQDAYQLGIQENQKYLNEFLDENPRIRKEYENWIKNK